MIYYENYDMNDLGNECQEARALAEHLETNRGYVNKFWLSRGRFLPRPWFASEEGSTALELPKNWLAL